MGDLRWSAISIKLKSATESIPTGTSAEPMAIAAGITLSPTINVAVQSLSAEFAAAPSDAQVPQNTARISSKRADAQAIAEWARPGIEQILANDLRLTKGQFI
jgi:hypothetical protein